MKKHGFVAVFVILGAMAVFAQTPRDGFYFAQAPGFSADGWREQVALQVSGGKISSASWNFIGIAPGSTDRKAAAKAGKDTSGWAAQAALAEQFLVSSQNTGASSVNGVTVPVAGFFDLAKKALAGTPVAKGIYKKDGWYYGEAGAFDSFGTKDTVLITVVNGTIVDVLWNGILKDAPDQSKIIYSSTGKYRMVRLGRAKAEWHVQATLGAAELVKVQDPAKIPVRAADSKTDAISGVSIMVKEYLEVAGRALSAAK
jgi:major membrane immunogen (membrane-anchored lipoprotein)